MTQMWGAMELWEAGQEQERQYLKEMRPAPLGPDFTFAYFSSLVDKVVAVEKRSVKGLLTQGDGDRRTLVPGLGNAISQDILFRAGLHPRHPLAGLSATQLSRLYDAILGTLEEVIARGGRYDKVDLYNRPGGYVRLMDSRTAGGPCPACGTPVEKIQYLGGACYFCPHCQV
jgi:formamidopyrimidine-DNA glycosylase